MRHQGFKGHLGVGGKTSEPIEGRHGFVYLSNPVPTVTGCFVIYCGKPQILFELGVKCIYDLQRQLSADRFVPSSPTSCTILCAKCILLELSFPALNSTVFQDLMLPTAEIFRIPKKFTGQYEPLAISRSFVMGGN